MPVFPMLFTCINLFMHECMQSHFVMSLCNPMDDRLPGPSVHGDSAGKKRSGFPGPPLGDLPDTGIEALSQASTCIGRQVLYH